MTENGKKKDSTSARLNKLRAGVLGANDGIVSVAATVIGVAAATDSVPIIATAGFAALSAGAFSMATGEYISVSTQRDTESAIVERVSAASRGHQDGIVETLGRDLEDRGVSADVARLAATQMATHDAVGALSCVEGIDPDDLVNPWHAAWASFFSFVLGAALPVASILLFPPGVRIVATFAAVLLALALTGFVSARLGEAHAGRAVIRTMLGGALGMIVTYGVGTLFNVPA
ncbi:MAG: VIT family protein [Actinobacteria bacterium]|nr:VIT family protein [Actinomycetota bacterium]